MDLSSFNLPLLFAAAALLLLVYVIFGRGRARYPPGPTGYPILGNLPQIDFAQGIHMQIEKWRPKYGDLFTMWFGPRPVVVLAGYDLIHEALVTYGEKFMDRPKLFIADQIFQGRGLFFQPYSRLWKETRKLALKTMRDLGVGKSSLEEKILDEVSAMQTEILKEEGKPFEIRRLLQNAMANVICSVNFGNRFEYEDPKFQRLLDLVNDFFSVNPAASPINFFPWLRFVPGIMKSSMLRPVRILRETRKLVEEEVQNHRNSFDPENVRDFVDVFLKAEQESKGDEHSLFMEGQLFQTIHDLFNAGSETAATSISWVLLYMIRHPEAQQRCHEELDRVIGGGRACSIKDKPKLPFVEACILESQRKGNIAVTTPPHATLTDVEFHGYYLPKQTMIIPSLWLVHHDPKYWKNPEEWNPNRWLDVDNKIIRHEAFMPFSTGFRTCAGQQLAQMEMFVILTCLLQHFKFTCVPGGPSPPDEGITGLTRRPASYKLCAIKR